MGGDSPSPEGCQTSAALLHPLSQFYLRAGWELPIVEAIAGEAVPGTAGAVLVHDREMTVGLERHHATEVGLHVLARVRRDELYARQVLLTRADDQTALALAAVELRLDALPPDARVAVLAEETPLGYIVRRVCPTVRRVHHGYVRLRPDAHVRRLLCLDGTSWAYGRRGALADVAGRPFASIIEVVSPRGPVAGG